MRVIFILIALGAVGAAAFQTPAQCEGNKVSKCGCTTTCESRPECSPAECEPGCYCPDGEVEHEGECIHSDDCAQEVPPPEDTDEEPDSGSDSDPDSDTDSDDVDADTDTDTDLDTDTDDVDADTDTDPDADTDTDPDADPDTDPDTDLDTDADPDADPDDAECPEDQEFKCGSACPATCDNTDMICTQQCVRGCFCSEGTVLHQEKCITEDECPANIEQEGEDTELSNEEVTPEEIEGPVLPEPSPKPYPCRGRYLGRKHRHRGHREDRDREGDDENDGGNGNNDPECPPKYRPRHHPHPTKHLPHKGGRGGNGDRNGNEGDGEENGNGGNGEESV